MFVLFVYFALGWYYTKNAVIAIHNYNTDIFPAFTPSPPFPSIAGPCGGQSIWRIPWRSLSILHMEVQLSPTSTYECNHQLLEEMKDYRPNRSNQSTAHKPCIPA